MPHDPQKYLFDMQSSTRFLLAFASGKTVDDYERDRGFRAAVERELQNIGEALRQLDFVSPEIASRISGYRKIIGFRNVLVHGYASLIASTVWDVVANKLKPLDSEIGLLIQDLES